MKHDNLSGVLKPVVRGRGGVSVAHHKNTSSLESVRMPAPAKVILPMQQHIGAPCTPTVKPGDKVEIGQVVGDSDKFVSAPIHATISGTVKSIADIKLTNGASSKAVVIESDGEMKVWDGVKPPVVESFVTK